MFKSKLQSPTQKRGLHYETLALNFLKKQGLSLVERNFNCRCGEIDLIFTDKVSLIFVEVRFRKSRRYGSASETVHYFKQQKIIKAAQFYLLKHRSYQNFPCRFDIVGINKNEVDIEYQWIKNAFH